jgi:uncharacterized membrane protein HdeD (DUF308 family)
MTDAGRIVTTASGVPRAGAGWAWILAYGVVSALLGLLAFLAPFSATLAATLTVGAFLTVTGVMALASGLFGREHHHRGYAIIFGILSIVVGLITAFRPLTGAFSITLLIAAWLLVRGAMEIGWGVSHRLGRVTMVLLGVLNIVLAALIVWTVPISALTLPGYVLGLSLLFGGVTAVASAVSHRRGASAFALT